VIISLAGKAIAFRYIVSLLAPPRVMVSLAFRFKVSLLPPLHVVVPLAGKADASFGDGCWFQ
jgi:hypothetical protein